MQANWRRSSFFRIFKNPSFAYGRRPVLSSFVAFHLNSSGGHNFQAELLSDPTTTTLIHDLSISAFIFHRIGSIPDVRRRSLCRRYQ